MLIIIIIINIYKKINYIMGQKTSNLQNSISLSINNETTIVNDDEEKVTKNSFELINVIGRGGFGKVWKVYEKKYKKIYAMKEMSKVKIIDKNSILSIKKERELLSKIYHPFIINMYYSFQDRHNLYIIMDYLKGGDLRFNMSKNKGFNEEQTKFIVACIILSLEYIHNNNIIHRDLKPENLLFNKKGYIKLTDFGISKIYNKYLNNSNDTSGTPGYMSPEVLNNSNHNFCVDYYALGVIIYEILVGNRPYKGNNRKEIKEDILSKQVLVTKKNLNKKKWSHDSGDFINKLIQRKPNERLGFNGIKEIKNHPWLKYFNWKDLYLFKLKAPYIPKSCDDNYDTQYCNLNIKNGISTLDRYMKIELSDDYKSCFNDFEYYDRRKDNNIKNIKNEESCFNQLNIKKNIIDISNKFINNNSNDNSTENNINNNSNNNSNNFENNSTCEGSIVNGKLNKKSKSRNIIIESKNYDKDIDDGNSIIISKTNQFKTYVNPHLIYKILDVKEKNAFYSNTKDDENISLKYKKLNYHKTNNSKIFYLNHSKLLSSGRIKQLNIDEKNNENNINKIIVNKKIGK